MVSAPPGTAIGTRVGPEKAARIRVFTIAIAAPQQGKSKIAKIGVLPVAKHISVSATAAVIKVFQAGSDWQMSYRFKMSGNCWYVDEFQNHSL